MQIIVCKFVGVCAYKGYPTQPPPLFWNALFNNLFVFSFFFFFFLHEQTIAETVEIGCMPKKLGNERKWTM